MGSGKGRASEKGLLNPTFTRCLEKIPLCPLWLIGNFLRVGRGQGEGQVRQAPSAPILPMPMLWLRPWWASMNHEGLTRMATHRATQSFSPMYTIEGNLTLEPRRAALRYVRHHVPGRDAQSLLGMAHQQA